LDFHSSNGQYEGNNIAGGYYSGIVMTKELCSIWRLKVDVIILY